MSRIVGGVPWTSRRPHASGLPMLASTSAAVCPNGSTASPTLTAAARRAAGRGAGRGARGLADAALAGDDRRHDGLARQHRLAELGAHRGAPGLAHAVEGLPWIPGGGRRAQ